LSHFDAVEIFTLHSAAMAAFGSDRLDGVRLAGVDQHLVSLAEELVEGGAVTAPRSRHVPEHLNALLKALHRSSGDPFVATGIASNAFAKRALLRAAASNATCT
jgi:hypothetical protein